MLLSQRNTAVDFLTRTKKTQPKKLNGKGLRTDIQVTGKVQVYIQSSIIVDDEKFYVLPEEIDEKQLRGEKQNIAIQAQNGHHTTKSCWQFNS